MNKASLLASAALASLAFAAAPAFAQGPFADVPSDHWAYAAVDKLQKKGIVIGYPDQTYGGKRQMTRYEFAIAIARLLDLIEEMKGGTAATTPPDLSIYALKTDLNNYATKADLEALAAKMNQGDIATLKKLLDEFKAELVAFNVDLDAIKKRLDDLEKRVKAIEDEHARFKISGAVSLYGRANSRSESDTNPSFVVGGKTQSVRDANGFEVTGGPNRGEDLFDDARVFHDVDVNLDARLGGGLTAHTTLNFGNYLPFLNSIGSFTGFRSDRNSVAPDPYSGTRTQLVNQAQQFTVYQAYVDTGIESARKTGFQVGRLPLQLTPYTLKLMDVDFYFNNEKTDSGNIPVDGVKAQFTSSWLGITAFAAKTDPILFLSNVGGNIPGQGGYGLFAGAGRTGYGSLNGLRGQVRSALAPDGTSFITGNRPVFSGVSRESNGAMSVEQLAGARAEIRLSKIGTIGGTYMLTTGSSAVNPVSADFFNRVEVLGVDVTTNLFGIGINGSWTQSNSTAEDITNSSTLESRVDDDDQTAYDINAGLKLGSLYLMGGYRQVGAFFGAPGYWTRISSFVNPTDIKGFYGEAKFGIKRFDLGISGQFYEGTGDAVNLGGLTEDDKINNIRGYVNLGLGAKSSIDASLEMTEWEVLEGFSSVTSNRVKPREMWYSFGYGYTFNPNASLRLGYQFIEYDDKNSGFDSINGDGGVATAQFRVKF
jgi:tetrahydromethanopterin S-methyltransferase subunit G